MSAEGSPRGTSPPQPEPTRPRRLQAQLGHLRTFGRQAAHRVSQRSNTLALGAVSAGVSFALATTLYGSEDAVFAPIAAVVSTGLSAGHRLRRAVEICFGVFLGLVAADLLGHWLGIGAWQLAVAVLLARMIAVALSASVLLSNQAAVAAVVVMTVSPLLDTNPWVRLGDGLVGGVTAVALTAVFAPDPFRGVSMVIQRVLGAYAAQLERLRLALVNDSLTEAEGVLITLQSMTSARQDLRDAMAAARERIRLGSSRTREAQRSRLYVAELLSQRIEVLISSGMGLSRAGGALVRHPGSVPAPIVEGLGELVRALQLLGVWARGEASKEAVRERAIAAAVTASQAAERGASTAVSLMVGQIRAAVVDVLRILDLAQREAVAALEAAAGRVDQLGTGMFEEAMLSGETPDEAVGDVAGADEEAPSAAQSRDADDAALRAERDGDGTSATQARGERSDRRDQ